MQLGFLASHRGTNLQAILDACKTGRLQARPRAVISNNSDSGALQRARKMGVPAAHLSTYTHPKPGALDEAILAILQAYGVEVVCLAGYMKRLGPRTLAAYRGRVLNIHPSLLPRFGGQGFYGDVVHRTVLAAGERETGATVHLVDEEYDHGQVLDQVQVPVEPGDSVETLASRVLQQEHRLYVRTLQRIAAGEIELQGL
ncbi:MAG: phosphoribosylglycinamide formyltransferase [Gemmatimonadetes bacterium]|nr:phosphoribosylglycinamide formyltransferase [Gemmatimonadota bacterium]MYF74038.1 phosphoribosylglycinamide formyltransferase [Gemmatimonadota bacterium]MYK52574.1 phosphoribosylglycinamide formyltransferase [Gemmatimonadota bacterium]